MPRAWAQRRHAPAEAAQQPEHCLCRGGGGGSRRCSGRQRAAAWLVVTLSALMSVLHGVHADPADAPSTAAMSSVAAAAKSAIVPAPTQQHQNGEEPRLDSDQILSEVSVWSWRCDVRSPKPVGCAFGT